MKRMIAVAGLTMAVGASAFGQQVLWDNGPIITNETGGTGTILGQPISNPDPYFVPGDPNPFFNPGIPAITGRDTRIAEDFTVPEGETWDLNTITLFASQTGQTTPFLHMVKINLWMAPPIAEGSPEPLPDPVPVPVFAESIPVNVTGGEFVCYRQSNETSFNSSSRRVFAFEVSLNDLPNGGILGPGTYWIEWSFDCPATGAQMTNPLVVRAAVARPSNARLHNSVDGSSTAPRVWFEGREGYVAGVAEGRAYEFPFVLKGTVGGTPTCGSSDFDGDGDFGTDADIEAWFACLAGNCCATCFVGGSDFNMDGDFGTDADIEAFFRVLAGGAC